MLVCIPVLIAGPSLSNLQWYRSTDSATRVLVLLYRHSDCSPRRAQYPGTLVPWYPGTRGPNLVQLRTSRLGIPSNSRRWIPCGELA
eukprot:2850210-Rhodomonas_salina.3